MVTNAKQQGFSLLIVRLSIAAVCISTVVMLLAISISKGYQKEVRSKLIGFNAHYQINNLDLNNSIQLLPIQQDTFFENNIAKLPEFKHLQKYVTKAGIIKTEDEFEGILLKGIDINYKLDFLKKNVIEGNIPDFNLDSIRNEIIISKNTAQKLGFKLNDNVIVYFLQEPPRVRKFKIVAIFNTGLSELDELNAFTDIKILQKLNGYEPNQITGYEIFVNEHSDNETAFQKIKQIAPYHFEVKSIDKIFPQMTDWLNLLDLNVIVIIILMIVVAAINMITALLILIVERSNMIGILKALGSTNKQVQHIFIYMAANIIIKGLLAGNLIAIFLIVLQQKTGIFKLNPEDYYLDTVPLDTSIVSFITVNIFSFFICVITLFLPVKVVSKITPAKSIRFN